MLEYLKEGFSLVNHNLQLVFIRILVAIINLTGIVIFLIFPVIALIAYLGIDVLQAKDLVPVLVSNPLGFISKYLGLVILFGISFLIYLLCASMLILYALGGTLGTLRRSAVDRTNSFSFHSFFQKAGAHFTRLLWLLTLVTSGIAALFFVFMVTGGLLYTIVKLFSTSGGVVETFFHSFVLITIVIISILIAVGGGFFTVYSMVILVADREGVVESIRRTAAFLNNNPLSFLLFLILFLIIIILNVFLYGMQAAFSVIPVVVPFIYLAGLSIQYYLTIFAWGSLTAYYLRNSSS